MYRQVVPTALSFQLGSLFSFEHFLINVLLGTSSNFTFLINVSWVSFSLLDIFDQRFGPAKSTLAHGRGQQFSGLSVLRAAALNIQVSEHRWLAQFPFMLG